MSDQSIQPIDASVSALMSAPSAPYSDIPAWKALADTGVQSFAYPDAPRQEIYSLFVHEPSYVLDIGCGTGAVGCGLQAHFNHVRVWGCELDTQAAQLAASRLQRVLTDPIQQWSESDRAELTSFDTILLLDVLEHMYNPWQELQFLAQHIRSDAQVIVSLPNVGHFTVLNALIHGDWSYVPAGILDVTHIRFFTENSMLNMFAQTGFTVEAKQYVVYGKVEEMQQFPSSLQTSSFTIQVRDEAHWMQLNSVQILFRLRKSVSD